MMRGRGREPKRRSSSDSDNDTASESQSESQSSAQEKRRPKSNLRNRLSDASEYSNASELARNRRSRSKERERERDRQERSFSRHIQPQPPPSPGKRSASPTTPKRSVNVLANSATTGNTPFPYGLSPIRAGPPSRAGTPRLNAATPTLTSVLKDKKRHRGERDRRDRDERELSVERPATPVTLAAQERVQEAFRALLQGHSDLSDWQARFTANSICYPLVQPPSSISQSYNHNSSSFNTATPISPSFHSPQLSTPATPSTPLALEEPWRRIHASLSGGPTTKFPYALSLARIESLPIPSFVQDGYLNDESRPLCLQIRVSLFDLETGTFFGRTWIDPEEFDLRAGSSKDSEDPNNNSSETLNVKTGGARRRGSVRITKRDTDNNDDESETEGSETLGRNNTTTQKKADAKRRALVSKSKKIKRNLKKKAANSGRQSPVSNDGNEENGSDADEYEEDGTDGDSEDDDGSDIESESRKKKKHREIKALKHKRRDSLEHEAEYEEEYGEDSDNDGSNGSVDSDDGAILKGQRVSINLHRENLFLHTNLISKNVIAVIEFVLIVEDVDVDEAQVDPDLFKPEFISAGWTFFHLFDADRNGIDIERAWEYEEVFPYEETESSTPIFHGSPRILMFIAPLLMEYGVGYPSLAPIPGARFKFEFSTRPAFRQLAYLWRENTWIGQGNDVPGLRFFSAQEMGALEDSVAVVSKIRISVFPSLSVFETALLSDAALKYYQAFPDSMTPDSTGALPLPEIIERRIHIGIHNTHTFLTAPTITTLKPVYSEYVGGDGFEFVFNGNVELDKYVAGEDGLAVVFVVEYKIMIMTNPVEKKKGGLVGVIIDRLTGNGDKKESGPVGIEKIVTVIPLDTRVGPNPYSALIFSPTPIGTELEQDEDWLDYAFEMGRLATLEFPIVLSFYFYDQENPESPAGRSSPIRDAIPEEDEEDEENERAATPKRPATPPPLPSKHRKPDSDDDSDHGQDIRPASPHPITTDPNQFPRPSRYRGRKGGALTRAERARLQSAGYVIPLDESGAKPAQLTLTPGEVGHGIHIDLELEAKDAFRNNEVTFTLMGVSFTPELCVRLTGHFPTSVYFTYQFYNFPYCSTERVHIYTGPMPPGDSGSQLQHHRSFSAPQNNHSRRWSQSSSNSYHSNATTTTGTNGRETADGKDGSSDCYWPGILYSIDEDGSVVYAPAGLSRTYLIENDIDSCSTISSYSKHVPDIVQYLNSKTLHLDVWDGDSLLHLGAAVIELKPMLRQGKGGVMYDDDVDIVFTEYLHPAPIPRSSSYSSDMSSVITATSGGAPERTSRSTIVGKLHVRLMNVARTPEVPENPMNHEVKVATKRQDPYSKENVLVRDHRHRIHLRPEIIANPLKLVDIDSELAHMLSTAYEERVRSRKKLNSSKDKKKSKRRGSDEEDDDYLESISDRRRKLDRVKRVLEKNHAYTNAAVEGAMPQSYNLTRQERQRDLDTIDICRNRRKPSLIEKRLAEQITVTHLINAAFAQAYYFEYIFTNPYNEDHNFEITWADEELRLVTSTSEWKYLRRIHSVRVGVEDKLISVRKNGISEIYMLANESVSIPFVFQSFLGGSISNGMESESSILGRRGCGNESLPGGGIHPRTINVSFLNDKRMPIAMIDVTIKPRNYSIDRVLRFFRPEGEVLRRNVRFYLSAPGAGQHSEHRGDTKDHGKKTPHITENSTIYDASHPWKKYARCNNPDVICTLSDSGKGHGNLKEISFKYRVGSAPETAAIYFLLFDDPYHTSLHEVWRIFVHSLHRLDVNCILGQSNHSSLVLRGSSFSRTVQCFSNLPDELLVTASAPFILTANSLNEIGMLMRPRSESIRDVILNVVGKTVITRFMLATFCNGSSTLPDVDDQSLVSSWLVVSHCTTPTVTKSFEISIPRGKAVNKRVSYTNPYSTRRNFKLKTNAEHLVQFREGNLLQLDGGASQYISLRLLPNSSTSWSDVLIFLNDDHDKIEECLRIRVSYSQ
ncbi:hypothetical protein BJ741DRAFT_666768 [Chytriomyces cf. hyalinus JEL632]|nr:hypothetical protein BJ741DRAFT_666768 [Chytriomyces cf. hyalinus JEL632]